MKKLIAFCFITLVVLSCKKDPSPKIEVSCDYLPLKVGNYWNFELAGKYLVRESYILNGTEYFGVINDNGTSTFYRKHDNKIYVKELALENTEEMKFDLTAETNSTWTYGKGNVTLITRNATVTIGEMQIDSCLQFNFHNKNLTDYGFTIWLAPRIGFIQQTCQECFGSSFEIMKLLKANINNQEIEFNKYVTQ
jgi:hypothetical protein